MTQTLVAPLPPTTGKLVRITGNLNQVQLAPFLHLLFGSHYNTAFCYFFLLNPFPAALHNCITGHYTRSLPHELISPHEHTLQVFKECNQKLCNGWDFWSFVSFCKSCSYWKADLWLLHNGGKNWQTVLLIGKSLLLYYLYHICIRKQSLLDVQQWIKSEIFSSVPEQKLKNKPAMFAVCGIKMHASSLGSGAYLIICPLATDVPSIVILGIYF